MHKYRREQGPQEDMVPHPGERVECFGLLEPQDCPDRVQLAFRHDCINTQLLSHQVPKSVLKGCSSMVIPQHEWSTLRAHSYDSRNGQLIRSVFHFTFRYLIAKQCKHSVFVHKSWVSEQLTGRLQNKPDFWGHLIITSWCGVTRPTSRYYVFWARDGQVDNNRNNFKGKQKLR